jgi:hypothetical protein
MKTFNKYVLLYLKWASPIAVLAAALSGFGYSGNNLFYDITGITTIIWLVGLIYVVFTTSLSPSLRDSFVRWLSGIKENDERESQITGVVSKKTFIFMTGILILLLFLSVIRIDIYRNKDLIAQGKEGGMISFGMGLRFIESPDDTKATTDTNRDYIVKYHGLPLASDGVLVVILALQLGAFYITSRKTEQLT